MGWGGGREKGALLFNFDGVLLYLDHGGGYTQIYTWEKTAQNDTYTQTHT